MAAIDLLILERIEWDWFVSCTVKKRNASDVYLSKKAFALLRWIARKNKVRFHNLPWALRIESGIDPEHRHFHFLVGGLVHTGLGMRMVCIHRWEYLLGTTNPKNPKGTCRVRLYVGSGGAVSYLAQVLNASENKGWTESNVRISHAAMSLAHYGACSSAAGLGAFHRSM